MATLIINEYLNSFREPCCVSNGSFFTASVPGRPSHKRNIVSIYNSLLAHHEKLSQHLQLLSRLPVLLLKLSNRRAITYDIDIYAYDSRDKRNSL